VILTAPVVGAGLAGSRAPRDAVPAFVARLVWGVRVGSGLRALRARSRAARDGVAQHREDVVVILFARLRVVDPRIAHRR